MDERFPSPGFKGWWSRLQAQQRMAVVVLTLCGLSALGLSLVQLRDQLTAPFMIPKNRVQVAQKFFAEQEREARKLDEMRQRDTDHDGLSDYDEVSTYRTSPYLADSDSDTVPDSIEIAQGADPNCPQGKTCFQASNDVGIGSVSSGAAFQEFLQAPQVSVGAQKLLQNPPDPATMTPAQIREYLLSNNLVAKEELDLLPDAAVVEVYAAAYQDALKIQGRRGGSSPSLEDEEQ